MTHSRSTDDSLRGQLLIHQAFFCRLARSLVREAAGAEDLVQDAWVIALQRARI